MKNECGKCNVCCRILRIDKKFLSWRNTDKARGELCDKYVNNRCVKYLTRPNPCKKFKCFWLQLVDKRVAKPEWRPDKIGAMIKLGEIEGKPAIMIEELEKGSLDFNHLSPEQDELLRITNDLSKESNYLLLIRPFGHDHQYPLRFNPDTK